MDNNSTSNVAPNTDSNDSNNVAVDLIIDITQAGPTAIMDSNRQLPMTPEAQQELVDMLMTVEENVDIQSEYEASFTESDIENMHSHVDDQDPEMSIRQHTRQNTDVPSSSSSQSTPLSTPELPTSNSMSSAQRRNRRARVEDDHDEDRDRRHPSQRVGDSNGQTPASNANPFFPSFLTSFRDAGAALGLGAGYFNRTAAPNPSGNHTTPNLNSNESSANATPGTSASSQSEHQRSPQTTIDANNRPPMHIVDYEFSIVMDGSGRVLQRAQHQEPASNGQGLGVDNVPTGAPSGPATHGTAGLPPNIPLNATPFLGNLSAVHGMNNVPTGALSGTTTPGTAGLPANVSLNAAPPLGNLSAFLGMPFAIPGGGLRFPPLPEEKEDPERARRLVDGLEEVPFGLVRRLERVGTGVGGMGEEGSSSGDVGCAICWDRLLHEVVEHERWGNSIGNRGGSDGMIVDKDVGGQSETKYPKIVSLPCAHVFHAECLIPWFSRPRHTTCPTCRFNIDPDNLTYVPATRRRRELRRAANNTTQPSEATPDERTAAATDVDEEPQERRDGNPIVDFGARFADILQMFNMSGQPQPQQPVDSTPVNGDDLSDAQTQTQAQEPPPLITPIPLPVGEPSNLFPTAGQLPMLMPMLPFTLSPAGVPMPMPWGPNPTDVATDGTAMDADVSTGNPIIDSANPIPATSVNERSPSNNAANSPQNQPTRQRPTVFADVIRISVDMVFGGRPGQRANHDPVPLSATIPSQDAQSTTQEAMDDDTGGDHDSDVEPPRLLSPEEVEEQDRQMTEFLNQLGRNRPSSDAPPAANDNSEPASQTQPMEAAQPQLPPPVYSMDGVHVAGTGRSFEEAFSEALSRLQTRLRQPRQEGQNPEPPDASADENLPTSQQPQAEPQPPGQRPPWHFMPMAFMDFAVPMRPPQPEGPKRAWTLPPAPGLTLRQLVERREREAGLRCHDVSCGLGPSDEDPFGDDINDALREVQQLSIMSNEEGARKSVCEHKIHGMCLVSAERVALRGAEAVTNEAGCVEVSCPVCRGTGCVTKEQWDEGVRSL